MSLVHDGQRQDGESPPSHPAPPIVSLRHRFFNHIYQKRHFNDDQLPPLLICPSCFIQSTAKTLHKVPAFEIMRPDLQAAGLMTKFSSRPRPADCNAARIRNNQRRHRARVKTHIADLETRLGETKAHLDAALAKINQLTAEVEALRKRPDTRRPASTDPESSRTQSSPDSRPKADAQSSMLPSLHCCASPSSCPFAERTISEMTGPSAADGPSSLVADVLRSLSTVRMGNSVITHLPNTSSAASQEGRPPTGCAGDRLPPHQSHSHGESDHKQSDTGVIPDSDCNDLSPPCPGESTTTCRDAYKVIEQQNFSGLDVAAITSWLKPGFRRATQQGGGCRVETHLLFALLDYISSSHTL